MNHKNGQATKEVASSSDLQEYITASMAARGKLGVDQALADRVHEAGIPFRWVKLDGKLGT